MSTTVYNSLNSLEVIVDPDLPPVDDQLPGFNDPVPAPCRTPSTISNETVFGDHDTPIGNPDTFVFDDSLNPGPSIDLSFNAAGELIDPVDATFDALISAPVSEIGNRIDVMMHFDADDFIV